MIKRTGSGRLLRAVLAGAAAAVLACTGAGAANAVNADLGHSIVSDNPANWTPHVMDGSVNGIVQLGGKMYAVGTFTTVRQTVDGPDVIRNGIFAFDAATGAIDMGFDPNLGGSANSIDTDGTYLYIGGDFNSVAGKTSHRKVAMLDATGKVVRKIVSANAAVNEVVVRGGKIYIGGRFTLVGGVSRVAFAAINIADGSLDTSTNVVYAGQYNGGVTSIVRMDATPDGSKFVTIGNFTTVGGQPRQQVAVIDTPAGAPAAVDSWATSRYDRAVNSCANVFDTFTRDVDVDQTGSYFVISTTGAFAGGAATGTMCDSTQRWQLGSGAGQQPVWVNYTGGDTTYGVAIAGDVVYLGGHFRWSDNPFQGDQAGPGAAPREGIAAIDAVNGLPLTWNPGRDRGVGAQAIYVTPNGLWVGSDTTRIAMEERSRIAFLPLAGGGTMPQVGEPPLPNTVFGAANPAAAGNFRVNAGGGAVTDPTGNWTSDAGLVSGGNGSSRSGSVTYTASVPTSTPKTLFKSERSGNQTWHFAVPAGHPARVRLYFSEQYAFASWVGARVFNVSVENGNQLQNFDIMSAAGGYQRAMTTEIPVTSDGSVDISMTGVVGNPIVNAIEVIDDTPGGLVQRSLDATATPTTPVAVANTAMNWAVVRGATMVGDTLYYGKSDGLLYARPFDADTATLGTERTVDLLNDPDNGAKIPFNIAAMTGLAYDATTHRLYYTVAGDANLYYRSFTVQSEKVGSQTFTAANTGINFSTAAGLAIGGGQLLYGSSADGSLRAVPFVNGTVAGAPVVTSADGSWKYRAMFLDPNGPPPPNQAPTASFTTSCTSLFACTFDASGSADADGSIVGYAWDFGDGSTGTGVNAQHTYSTAGDYTVTLTVTDNRAGTATSSSTVSVVNVAPTASFTASCDSARVCTLNASASSDSDGSIVGYTWDFGDAGTGTGVSTTHTYGADGTYPVSLTVTDNGGLSSTTVNDVTAQMPPPPAEQVSFVGAASAMANASTVTATIPAATQAGDLIVVNVTQNANTTTSAPTGSGWTMLGAQAIGAGDLRSTTWYKLAAAGDAATPAGVTFGALTKSALDIVVYRGVDQTAPVASFASAAETTSRTTHTTPGAADVSTGSWVVSFWADKSSATTDWVEPGGQSVRAEDIGAGSGRVTTLLTDGGGPTVGAQPGLTATANAASAKAVTWTLVVRP